MPGATQPQSASGSIFDFMTRLMPQTSGIMKASDALGMASQQGQQSNKAQLKAQLDVMKAKGPVDGHYSKAWQDQVDELTRRWADAK